MKTILRSCIPFTVLLMSLVVGIMYCDNLAYEKSNAYIEKEIKFNPLQGSDGITFATAEEEEGMETIVDLFES